MKTIHTMTGMFNHIKHMASIGVIDLEDFYNVSFDKNGITLQGRFKSDSLSDYCEFWRFHVNKCNGFVEAQNEFDGVEVKIVFT
jgi:hypothetical protein